jgi:oxygen-dependent protoporphyrinogen oxidase
MPDSSAATELDLGSSAECPLDTLVLGAGITGLTLAWRLQQKGRSIRITEAGSQVGGSVITQSRQGYLWEEGPNSFTPAPALLNLIADLGLAQDLLWADGKLPRYVWWQEELLPIPLSPPAAIGSPLLSVGGKLRALRGLLGFVGYPPGSEETVREFFTRQLGSEVVERLVIPFVSGVYAGDADQLSASAAFARFADLEAQYGSLFAGLWQAPRPPKPPLSPAIHPAPKRGQLGSLRQGLQHLPQTLAQKLGSSLSLGWRAQSLRATDSGYAVKFETPSGSQTLYARSVALGIPAYAAAEVLRDYQSQVSETLEEIPYSAVAVVTLAYPADALPILEGFGHLIPRSQGLRTLGTIWASSLFPGRAPAGYCLLLNFIGGATDPEFVRARGVQPILEMTSDQRVKAVHQDLSKILLKRPVDPFVLGDRLWQQAIPQYTLGHRQRIQRIETLLAKDPGLRLCGNYTNGVSLGDCVQRAEREAEQLARILMRSITAA